MKNFHFLLEAPQDGVSELATIATAKRKYLHDERGNDTIPQARKKQQTLLFAETTATTLT